MNDVCSHRTTISMTMRRTFGDILCMEYFRCLSCGGEYIRNMLLDGSPVACLNSVTGKSWVNTYKTTSEKIAAGESA